VPTQEWTRPWADADLYEKYALSGSEIAFIEKIVRPMDLVGNAPEEAASDDDE
jgi:site-specific DNA-methyltransferase (adenine-specific)